MERGRIKSRIGHVISNKMDKTVVVNITQIKNHPVYDKPIKRNKHFKAHDANNSCSIGDRVMIIESKPFSKTKKWRVSKILEHANEITENEITEQEQL